MNIAYVNIFVSDLKPAVEFYQSTLGLMLEHSEPEYGYAAFRVGTVRLGLAVAGQEQAELVGRHTGVGLAVEDLDSEYKRLTGKGVTFSMPPTKQPWGGYMALLDDADGNVFYLDQVSDSEG